MSNNHDLAREIRAIQQSTWILAGEIRKARRAAEQTRMLALTMFAHQYQAWLEGGSVGPEPVFVADSGGGAGIPPTLPPGGSFPSGQPGRPRPPVIDQELMEQIKDTLALSGAGTYDRQVNAQMRQMGVGLTITGWIWERLLHSFSLSASLGGLRPRATEAVPIRGVRHIRTLRRKCRGVGLRKTSSMMAAPCKTKMVLRRDCLGMITVTTST